MGIAHMTSTKNAYISCLLGHENYNKHARGCQHLHGGNQRITQKKTVTTGKKANLILPIQFT